MSHPQETTGGMSSATFESIVFRGVEDVPSSGTVRMISEATRQQILEHRANIMSDDPVKQHASTQHFRRLLSIERSPPIQEVIDAGVVPRFVQFLHMSDNPVRVLSLWLSHHFFVLFYFSEFVLLMSYHFLFFNDSLCNSKPPGL